jgi:hypothetical protein
VEKRFHWSVVLKGLPGKHKIRLMTLGLSYSGGNTGVLAKMLSLESNKYIKLLFSFNILSYFCFPETTIYGPSI